MKKNFQQNLLILLALCLCGLCVWQWYVQSLQRVTIERLGRDVAERNAALRSATNSVVAGDQQIALLDAQVTALRTTIRTNEACLLAQEREFQAARSAAAVLSAQGAEDRKALDGMAAQLREAASGIARQNALIDQLVAERDDLVKRHNAAVLDRNDVVTRLNELVKRMGEVPGGATPLPAAGGK